MSASIAVVGLGPGRAEYMSLRALEMLRSARVVLLRTARHPAAADLPSLGVTFLSLDWVYDSSAGLNDVYPRLAAEVIKMAHQADGTVTYAVPGHPLVAEASVLVLLEQAKAEGIEVEIVPSISSVELSLLRLGYDPLNGLKVADAQASPRPDPAVATLYLQLDHRLLASDLKLTLLEKYPPEHEVTLLQAVGDPKKEQILRLPLSELDHREDFDHLTSLFVPALLESQRPLKLQDLVDLMAHLRSPEGCPWDREQDHHSLRPCLEEETQEVLEAIEKEDAESLCEELGDLLLQVLFHAQLAAEVGDFDIRDILRRLHDKLIERHPHVFGEVKLETAAQVLEAWETLKNRKKALTTETTETTEKEF